MIKLSREIFQEIRGEYRTFSSGNLMQKIAAFVAWVQKTMTRGKWVLVLFLIFL